MSLVNLHLPVCMNETQPRLSALTVEELLTLDIKPRQMVLAPIIPEKGLVMLYSKRGVGKTHVALGMGYAVATGSMFLCWTAPQARRVLYVDGEMPLNALQERVASITAAAKIGPPSPDYLRLIAADHQLFGIPDLATAEGRAAVEEHLDRVDLLILDNLSTLCRSGRENESESWQPIQDWVLDLRRRGISILFVHHAGKGGAQRGTSRREDVLDTVINLKHSDSYTPDQGACFEVHLEKARGIFGEDTKPFEASMQTHEGVAVWTTRDLTDVLLQQVVDLARDGLSVRDIAEELGLAKSKVQRLKDKACEAGLLT